MDWFFYSLTTSILISVITVFSKVIITKHVNIPFVYIFAIGVIHILHHIFVLPWLIGADYPFIPSVIAFLSGVSMAVYVMIQFVAMKYFDMSRLVPVLTTYPIFVAILSQLFLGENIALFAWISILVAVCGAGLVSFGPSESGKGTLTIPLTLSLLLASFFFALAQFLVKFISDDIQIWPQSLIRSFGEISVLGVLVFLPKVRSGFVDLITTPKSLLLYLFAEGFLAGITLICFYSAIYATDVYLVSAVLITRPLFVFVLGLIMSLPFFNVLSEGTRGKSLIYRLLGTILTVLGVGGVILL